MSEIFPINSEVNLSYQDKYDIDTVISAAKRANADPYQSGYYVKAAGITTEGYVATGGNKENNLSDAWIHGETAVASGLIDRHGPDVEISAIGFYSENVNPDNLELGRPCGPCRDKLIQVTKAKKLGGRLILASGNENNIVAARLRDFMYEDFVPMPFDELRMASVKLARQALYRGMNQYLPPEMQNEVYGVALTDRMGHTWQGSLGTTAGYDSIPPGVAAVTTWENHPHSTHHRTDMNYITVVREGGIPDVTYRDRQKILELDEVLRLEDGRTEPLPVHLVRLESGKVVDAAITDTSEWLPYPFTPGEFGMHDVIQSRHDQLFNDWHNKPNNSFRT
jgi:cytidine deaminase